MKRGLARIWYRFINLFRTKPGPGEPLTFLYGSEEELRRVTTWACHINPPFFQAENKIVFRYVARFYSWASMSWTDFNSGPDTPTILYLSTNQQRYLDTWAALIVQYNRFTGTQWVYEYPTAGVRTITETPLSLAVTVHPASAHERAEALLALSKWLDGKVSEQEKRELLQLPHDVEV